MRGARQGICLLAVLFIASTSAGVNGQAAVNAAGANIVGSAITSGIALSAGDFSNASANGALQEISNAAVNTPAGIGGT